MVRTLSAPDIAVLLVYLVGVTGYGCWFYWRNRSGCFSSASCRGASRAAPHWPAWWRSPFHNLLVIVFGTPAILVLDLTSALLTRRPAPARP